MSDHPIDTPRPLPTWAAKAIAGMGRTRELMALAKTSRPTAPPEPPLPSKRRMAGQLARTVVATVARAIKGQPTRASAAEQARRWAICRACDHFRPSDRRCGKINGCGCWLDEAIPLAAKSCPLKPPKWGPEPASNHSPN